MEIVEIYDKSFFSPTETMGPGQITPFRRELISNEMMWCFSLRTRNVPTRAVISAIDTRTNQTIAHVHADHTVISVEKPTRAQVTCKISQLYFYVVLSHTKSSFAVVVMRKRKLFCNFSFYFIYSASCY